MRGTARFAKRGRMAATAQDGGDSPTPGAAAQLLEVKGLKVTFPTSGGEAQAVDSVSLSLSRGRTLAIVGESGSGKSVIGRSILGLHSERDCKLSGEIWLQGEQLIGAPARRVRGLRGQTMSMIFQDPLAALHPFYKVGWQVSEGYRSKKKVTRREARIRSVEMFRRVGFPEPERRVDDYPHQLSGGMRQRAMIAMALICNPALLIADEPTTALDVTVQAQILDLIRDLQREFDTGVILITHDFGVAAEAADEVLVLYAGQVMEQGSIPDVLAMPQHPYTWALLKSVTRLDRQRQGRLEAISGSPPSAAHVPTGCPFNPRCPYAGSLGGLCSTTRPPLREVKPAHWIACHLDDPTRAKLYAEQVAPNL
ncbi:MAG: ABC transporter ATP-binding protein [Candidatus Dormibacteria bacterium]